MSNKKGEIELKEVLNAFLAKIWSIIIVTLAAALILGSYSAFIKADTYTSKTTMMVSKESTSVNTGDIAVASKMVETYKVIIYSDSFLKDVIDDINNHPSYKGNDWGLTTTSIKDMFEVKQKGDTEVFDVAVTTKEASLSFAIADTLSLHIRDNLPKILPYPEGVIYTSVVDTAAMPVKADSKGVAKFTVIGGLLGAIIAMAVVFFRWYNDVTIRSRKSIEDNLDIPVLGVIPKLDLNEE